MLDALSFTPGKHLVNRELCPKALAIFTGCFNRRQQTMEQYGKTLALAEFHFVSWQRQRQMLWCTVCRAEMTTPQLAPDKGATGSQNALACEATPTNLLYRRIVACVEQRKSKHATVSTTHLPGPAIFMAAFRFTKLTLSRKM